MNFAALEIALSLSQVEACWTDPRSMGKIRPCHSDHREGPAFARNCIRAGSPQPSAKSSHVGLCRRMRVSFLSRVQPLIRVSRAMAYPNVWECLRIHQAVDAVHAREGSTPASFVVKHAKHETSGDANVQNPRAACHDVDVIAHRDRVGRQKSRFLPMVGMTKIS